MSAGRITIPDDLLKLKPSDTLESVPMSKLARSGTAALRAAQQDWYNPHAFAQALREEFPDRPLEAINSEVWHEGKRRLEAAVLDNTDFAFETTLGDNTITNIRLDAIAAGVRVSIWY